MLNLSLLDTGEKNPKKSELSSSGLLFNIIKSVVGVGILGISCAFQKTGWLFMPFMLIISVMTCYNAIKIAEYVVLFSDNQYDKLNYNDIGGYIFNGSSGIKLKKILKLIWGLEIVLICVLFYDMCVNFLKHLVDIPEIYFTLIVGFLLFLTTLSNNYSKFKWLSSLGNLAIISMYICLIYELFTDNTSEIEHKTVDWKNIPKSLGLTVFCFGGHVIFPDIFDSSKSRKNIKKMIISSWVMISIFSIMFGVMGYYLYGDGVKDNIIDNFLESAYLKNILLVMVTINIIVTYPLVITPLFVKMGKKQYYLKRLLFITILGVICYFWTSFIEIMSIVGGVLENLTSIIIPPLFVLKKGDISMIERVWNVLIIIMGIGILISTFTEF